MVDTVSRQRRSQIMAKVRSKDTFPELAVRKLLHALGYRYRLHRKDLPGCPDLVFAGRRKVIFVHGCFWHMHIGCRRARMPSTNRHYWKTKIQRNQIRDEANVYQLNSGGWRTMIIWECELADMRELEMRARNFLDE